MQRIPLMQQRLESAFAPRKLEIVDDSDQHIGHAGSQGGAGHYTVVIQAECLNNLSRIEAHRKIYQLFNDMMPEQIHALRIKILDT